MRPAAVPRRFTPRRRSDSTPGLIAIARKSDTRIHVITWREIHTTHRAAAIPMRISETWTIVRARNVTTRSGYTPSDYLRRRFRKRFCRLARGVRRPHPQGDRGRREPRARAAQPADLQADRRRRGRA